MGLDIIRSFFRAVGLGEYPSGDRMSPMQALCDDVERMSGCELLMDVSAGSHQECEKISQFVCADDTNPSEAATSFTTKS